MLFIKRLLSESSLTDSLPADYSIACISTTRPIYLVFGDGSDHPTYVIRKLTGAHDFKTHKVHKHLYHLVGDLVPKPIELYEYAGDQYDIQTGVQGAPWFQIKSRISAKDDRTILEDRLWHTLTGFHSALAADSDRNSTLIRPYQELRQVYSQYQRTEPPVNTQLEKLVECADRELAKVSDCSSIPQHGDFCLNNLIIDTAHITVIDFEDFGITNMPLYDLFTLALSLPSCSQEPHLAIDIVKLPQITTAAQAHGIPLGVIKWHFLHHILLRLGPWSAGEKRKQYRLWLKQVLDQFVDNQDTKGNLA